MEEEEEEVESPDELRQVSVRHTLPDTSGAVSSNQVRSAAVHTSFSCMWCACHVSPCLLQRMVSQGEPSLSQVAWPNGREQVAPGSTTSSESQREYHVPVSTHALTCRTPCADCPLSSPPRRVLLSRRWTGLLPTAFPVQTPPPSILHQQAAMMTPSPTRLTLRKSHRSSLLGDSPISLCYSPMLTRGWPSQTQRCGSVHSSPPLPVVGSTERGCGPTGGPSD